MAIVVETMLAVNRAVPNFMMVTGKLIADGEMIVVGVAKVQGPDTSFKQQSIQPCIRETFLV